MPWKTDTQWRHELNKSENLGWWGWQNMLRPYLKICEWEWIFGCAVKAFSLPGVLSPWIVPWVWNWFFENSSRELLNTTPLILSSCLFTAALTQFAKKLLLKFWFHFWITKGQLFSKCLFGTYLQFSPKTNEKIWIYYYSTSIQIVFVRFLGELKITKRHFKIDWSLVWCF